ncbi:hypothetical protein ACFYKX_05545 [Cytobacillus sp. FJAT-54145]|uniref:Uncharacterized protein n=1 Tax=Cytobacillus spartinae TaxID=3299023 RepID=A0ABW6K7A3_9BACI
MFNIFITIVLTVAIFASIAAWLNSQTILRELAEIKDHLGIKEERKKSFLDRDLDKD